MSPQDIIGFASPEDFSRMQQVVLEAERAADSRPLASDRFVGRVFHVIFTEPLEGTDDPNAPTQAIAKIQSGHRTDDELGETTGDDITIWNRTPAQFAENAYALVTEVEHDDRLYVMNGGGGGGSGGIYIAEITHVDCTYGIMDAEILYGNTCVNGLPNVIYGIVYDLQDPLPVLDGVTGDERLGAKVVITHVVDASDCSGATGRWIILAIVGLRHCPDNT